MGARITKKAADKVRTPLHTRKGGEITCYFNCKCVGEGGYHKITQFCFDVFLVQLAGRNRNEVHCLCFVGTKARHGKKAEEKIIIMFINVQ